jgi:hypothetical protein
MSKTPDNQPKTGASSLIGQGGSADEISKIRADLADLKSRLTSVESGLEEKKKEWQAIKARRLDSRYVAWVAIGLYLFTGIGFIILAYNFLTTDRSWVQASGVLGLCLIWSAFAALSMRLLSERCK